MPDDDVVKIQKDMITYSIFKTVDEIAAATFELLMALGASSEKTSAALSFGSTFAEIFQLWAAFCQENKPPLPDLFPADERVVPLDDPGSNWGLAKKLFIDSCGSDADRGRWPEDMTGYWAILDRFFGGGQPAFDLIFLGMGPDGHTASLFPDDCPKPGTPAWNAPVLSTTAPFDPPKRLTLGPGVIASARDLVLTVTGASKAEIFAKFYNDLQAGDDTLPSVRLLLHRKASGLRTKVFCDEAAAVKTGLSVTPEA